MKYVKCWRKTKSFISFFCRDINIYPKFSDFHNLLACRREFGKVAEYDKHKEVNSFSLKTYPVRNKNGVYFKTKMS